MTAPPDEVRDEAIRIAKVWGCVCRPAVTSWNQDPVNNVLRVSLRHQHGCGYRPAKFFEPPSEVDEAAIAESAKRAKKGRQRAARKYSQRGD